MRDAKCIITLCVSTDASIARISRSNLQIAKLFLYPNTIVTSSFQFKTECSDQRIQARLGLEECQRMTRDDRITCIVRSIIIHNYLVIIYRALRYRLAMFLLSLTSVIHLDASYYHQLRSKDL